MLISLRFLLSSTPPSSIPTFIIYTLNMKNLLSYLIQAICIGRTNWMRWTSTSLPLSITFLPPNLLIIILYRIRLEKYPIDIDNTVVIPRLHHTLILILFLYNSNFIQQSKLLSISIWILIWLLALRAV